MPIYYFWGEDEWAMQKAVASLRSRFVDPQWESFNYTTFPPEQINAVTDATTLVMTPPFGVGNRFVWLVNTTLAQSCSSEVLTELQRTLPVIPETSVLLLTSRSKPDGRLKSTQLLQKSAQFQEFPLIPAWKTEQIEQRVQQAAEELRVKLTPRSISLVAQSVGNNTQLLYRELEKLQLYADSTSQPLDVEVIAQLLHATTASSLQLAAAIAAQDVGNSLVKVTELLDSNEPALRIVATLIGQFRTWLWVKLMLETNSDINAVAQAAEISNPKRVYFLQQEVRQLSVKQLVSTLPILLELEVSLKQGAEERLTLQNKVIEMCQLRREQEGQGEQGRKE